MHVHELDPLGKYHRRCHVRNTVVAKLLQGIQYLYEYGIIYEGCVRRESRGYERVLQGHLFNALSDDDDDDGGGR